MYGLGRGGMRKMCETEEVVDVERAYALYVCGNV